MLTRPPSLMRGRHGNRVLELRPPSPADAPALIEAIHDSLPQLRPFMPFAHLDNTVDQQYERLVRVQSDYWGSGDEVFHLWHEQRMVGCLGLHQRTLNARGRELGYWIRTDVAGQGIGTFAVRSLVVLCFEFLGLERLQLLHNVANHGSRRVAEKCGFQVEGHLRQFETRPTPAMIRNGAVEERTSVMNALLEGQRAELDWYVEHRDGLEVWDWEGQPIGGGGKSVSSARRTPAKAP
ncbi:MAG: GNAT family N-acetyltransferase [Myxococcota bacterium]